MSVRVSAYSYIRYLSHLSIRLFICILNFCRYDYLKITNDRNQMIGKYCGQRTGLNVRINGSSYVVLTFRSDGSVQRNGFDLSFHFVSSGKYDYSQKTNIYHFQKWRANYSLAYTHGVRENLRQAALFVFLGWKNLLSVRTNNILIKGV